jgi:probable phosphoglycerate mutase
MRLILVRHCEPDWPEGWVDDDVGLTQRGREQARAVAQELERRVSGDGSTPVFSSPARRVVETAEIVASALGAPVQTEDMLWLKLLAVADVRRRFAEGKADEALLSELEGASERVWQWGAQLAQEQPDARVAVVSHDTVIAGVVCRTLSLPIANMKRFRVDLGSLSVIDFRAQRTILASLNETYHLEGLDLK